MELREENFKSKGVSDKKESDSTFEVRRKIAAKEYGVFPDDIEEYDGGCGWRRINGKRDLKVEFDLYQGPNNDNR
jgi:hypothetical protein